jgi:hypothetical protein
VVTVAFENHGERAGGARGGFFEEVEDGISNVAKVIVEEPKTDERETPAALPEEDHQADPEEATHGCLGRPLQDAKKW